MSWVGGKKALRDQILSRFPLDYKRYIEVFGGGGWVLFHKPPGKDFEVYNDFNGNLVTPQDPLSVCSQGCPHFGSHPWRFLIFSSTNLL